MKAQKLIAEYRTKISECEKQIEALTISIREAKKNNESEIVIDDLYFDKKIESSKMQLIIQFCKDLEDIA